LNHFVEAGVSFYVKEIFLFIMPDTKAINILHKTYKILPVWFKFYIDKVIHRWLNVLKMHFIVDQVYFTTLLFADNQIITAKSEEKFQETGFIYKARLW
jgi:hypothetical protein